MIGEMTVALYVFHVFLLPVFGLLKFISIFVIQQTILLESLEMCLFSWLLPSAIFGNLTCLITNLDLPLCIQLCRTLGIEVYHELILFSKRIDIHWHMTKVGECELTLNSIRF